MQVELMVVASGANLITGAALTLTPMWARPGMYFGVRVAPDYRESDTARRSRGDFRAKVWAATALAVALSALASATGTLWLLVAGLVIQIGTGVFAFRTAWRETQPHGLAVPATRTAHLFARSTRIPGGVPVIVIPFLIVAGTAAYLAAKWNEIPARFPIHWDFQGHVNGWSTRSFFGVFGPMLIAFVILTFIGGLIAIQVRAARPATAGSGRARRDRLMLGVPLIVMWMIAILFSVVGLTPLILRNDQFPIPAIVFLMIPIAGVVAALWLVARVSAEPSDPVDDNTPNECWKWGQIYYNPADPSIMVEKRSGLGYTLNFARWESWAMMGGVLAAPLIIIVLISRH